MIASLYAVVGLAVFTEAYARGESKNPPGPFAPINIACYVLACPIAFLGLGPALSHAGLGPIGVFLVVGGLNGVFWGLAITAGGMYLYRRSLRALDQKKRV
jgi:hypothetical protein